MKFLPYVLMLSMVNSCIELELSAPAFPSMVRHFGVTESLVGLTLTYNLLGFCFGAFLWGPLSDSFGRRTVMLWGNGLLLLGAFGCVLAPNMGFLLVSRFFQGMGAATSAVVVSAIIADVYSIKRASKLYGFMNAVFTSLMAGSPLMGGFLTQWIGWRGNYGFVALVCLVSWLVLWQFLPETQREKRPLQILGTIRDYKTCLFHGRFLRLCLVPSFLYGGYLSFVGLAPFIYMDKFNLSLVSYTVHQGVIIGHFVVASALFGWIVQWIGEGRTLLLGSILALGGGWGTLMMGHPLFLTVSMSLYSLGFALIYPLVFARSMEVFPHMRGIAASVNMGLRYSLCALVTVVSNYLYNIF